MSEIGPQMTPPERHRPGRSQCQTHMLARDGKRLVSFSGVLLAQNLGKPDSWDARDDWAYYDLSLYHAADGDYLVHWAYSTTQKGELFHHAVAKFDTLEGAINARAFNMCGDVATPNLYAVAQQNCLQ